MQWSARQAHVFAERISERLDAASTREDLEAAFAEHGLALEEKGKGHVVGNATSYVKLSRLGLQLRRSVRRVVDAARSKLVGRPRPAWGGSRCRDSLGLAAEPFGSRPCGRPSLAEASPSLLRGVAMTDVLVRDCDDPQIRSVAGSALRRWSVRLRGQAVPVR